MKLATRVHTSYPQNVDTAPRVAHGRDAETTTVAKIRRPLYGATMRKSDQDA